MRIEFGILKGDQIEKLSSVEEYVKAAQAAGGENNLNHQVAFDKVGEQEVSTIFLHVGLVGLFQKEPMWFETIIFGGPHDRYQRRYATYAEAFAAHHLIVCRLQEGKHPDNPENLCEDEGCENHGTPHVCFMHVANTSS